VKSPRLPEEPESAPKCALIVRVSTTGQAEGGFSLESQKQLLREIAARNNYSPYEEILEDDGYSGDNWDRPAIKRGLQLLKSGAVRALAWMTVDRFARDSPGGRAYIEQVLKLKGELVFGDIGKYSGDVNFRFMLDMKLVISEHEKRTIAERTTRGTRQKISQGLIHTSYAPYGYRKTEACGKRASEAQFAIDEAQGKVVRDVFRSADDGLSLRAIVRDLIDRGVAPPRVKWNATIIGSMLSNPVYLGMWHYNKRHVVEPETIRSEKPRHRTKTTSQKRDPSEWSAGIPIPAIIADRVLFDRVAKRMRENKQNYSGPKSDRALLRSLVWCGKCGTRFSCVVRQTGQAYYRCTNRDRVTGEWYCHEKSVRADALEDVVWKAMVDTLSDPAQLKAKLEAQRATLLAAAEPSKRQDLERTITEAKSKIDRCRSGYIDCAADDLEGQRYFNDELKKHRARLDQAQSELAHELPQVVAIQNLNSVVREFQESARTATREEQQELVRKWIARIDYVQGDVDVIFRIPLSASGSATGTPGAGGTNPGGVCQQRHNNVYKLTVATRVAA
jgi:site-specific DNA recombinase